VGERSQHQIPVGDDRSLVALVAFGMAFQIAAAFLFAWLRRPLAEAAAAH
jgi:hypothetical protein